MNKNPVIKSCYQAINQKMFCFKCQKIKGKEIEDTKKFPEQSLGRVHAKNNNNKKRTKELGWSQTSHLESFIQEDNGAIFSKT